MIGLHNGISNEIYRAFDAVSYSDLKAFVEGKKMAPSLAMNIGSALHTLVLEPDAEDEIAVAPADLNRATRDGKAAWAEFESAHPGKTLLLPRERKEVDRLVRALRENPDAMRILEADGDNEVSAIVQFPGRKQLSKARIDAVRKTCLVDIKTTGMSNQRDFEQSISKFCYDAQGAYYIDQVAAITGEHKKFVWICISKPALTCWVSVLQPQHYASGHRWYNDILTLHERYNERAA